jgi:SEC-C motif-containing protein
MRARFSAFALGELGYLRETWLPSTRPRSLTLEPDQRWTRLEVLASSRGGLTDDTGTVEFRAWFRDADGRGALHEHSRFARVHGRWVYVGPVPGTVATVER